jgi:hypothetical protein
VKRTLAVYPGSYLKIVNPAKPFTGVLAPVNVMHFDYLLWTRQGRYERGRLQRGENDV